MEIHFTETWYASTRTYSLRRGLLDTDLDLAWFSRISCRWALLATKGGHISTKQDGFIHGKSLGKEHLVSLRLGCNARLGSQKGCGNVWRSAITPVNISTILDGTKKASFRTEEHLMAILGPLAVAPNNSCVSLTYTKICAST